MEFDLKLKSFLEDKFSMPFEVSTSLVDGETQYSCAPKNDGNIFFEVKAFLHSSIRLIIEIYPQKHGGYILSDMAICPVEKQKIFWEFVHMIKDKGAKLHFLVNNSEIEENAAWPSLWRSFFCKLTKVPFPDNDNSSADEICEWIELSFDLIFSLLNIVDVEDNNVLPHQTEGTKQEVKSIRYERNPFNRQLCLHKKGYRCAICGLNFEDMYGAIGRNFIEVHHTTPVSLMGDDYILDIDRDLVPLCSNCHSMVHRTNPPIDVDVLRQKIQELNFGAEYIAAEPNVAYNKSFPNLIVGVVKPTNVLPFLNHNAASYYFGKKFPSKFNLKKIEYFAPYFNGGITGYYTVIGIRTAKKHEIVGEPEGDNNDIRIILELGEYHHISDTPRKIKLVHYNYACLPLSDIL